MKKRFTILLSALALLTFLIAPNGVWGQTVTLTQSNLGLTGSYTTNTEKTIDGITYVYSNLMKNNDNIQAKASTGEIHNFTAYPHDITSVAITHSGTARSTTISGSSDGTNWNEVVTGSGSITGDFSNKGYKYFKITRGSNAAYWTQIVITYGSTSTCATPTFNPEAGTYTETQNVTISCATEGATIYYTMGENPADPTSESTEYTEAIEVDATTTIKAIAVKEGMTNSSVASATYTIVEPITGYDIDFENELSLYTNWSFENIGIHTTEITAHGGEAWGSNVNDNGNGTSTASITTTSKIATPQSLTCYISKESGNTTSSTWYIQVSSDDTEWTNVESHSASSMTKGTWVEFTADLSSYANVYVRILYSGSTAIRCIDDISLVTTVSTTPTITATPNTLNPFFYVYNDGPSSVQTINVAGVNLTGDITAALTDGNDSAFEMYGTYGNTQTQYQNSVTFTPIDATVEGAVLQVRMKSGLEAGNYNDEITLTSANAASVTISVSGTVVATHTVEWALGQTEYPLEGIYVEGVISQIEEVSTNYKNATYFISDDGATTNELYVFRGRYLNNADFTSESQIAVGDRVVVYGDVIYNTDYDNPKQFTLGNYIVDLTHVDAPVISPESGEYNGQQEVTITQPGGYPIYYTTDGTEPTSSSTLYTTAFTVTPPATVKARAYDGAAFSAVTTAEYTSNQSISVNPLEIEFFRENTYDFQISYLNMNPVSAEDFGIQFYTDATCETTCEAPAWLTPSIVLDGEVYDGYVVRCTITDPTSEIHSTYFKVYSGTVYSNLVTAHQCRVYTLTIPTVEGVTITATDWEGYTIASGSPAFYFHDITLTPTLEEGYTINTLTVTNETGTETVDLEGPDADGKYTFSMPEYNAVVNVTVNAPVIMNYSINGDMTQIASSTLPSYDDLNDDFTFAGWTTNPDDVENVYAAGAEIPANEDTFYAVYSHTTTSGGTSGSTQGASYVKVTSTADITDGNYLIVYEGAHVAFDGSLGEDALDRDNNVIEVTIDNNTIASTETTDASVFTLDLTNGTVKSASGYYVGIASNSNGMSVSAEPAYENSFEIDNNGNAVIAAVFENSEMSLRFNGTNNSRFRYYKAPNQYDIQLYKYTGATTTTSNYTRVFLNETASGDITITGPSIVPSGYYLNMHYSNNMMESYTFVNEIGPEVFIIEDGAYFYGGTNGADNAQGTAKMSITGYGSSAKDNYYLLAAPLSEVLPKDVACMLGNDMDLYYYSEDGDGQGNEWINYYDAGMGSYNLENCKGYLYANKTSVTLEFSGSLNSGNVPPVFEAGWNLIGNSKTHPSTYDLPYYRLNAAGNALNAQTETTDVNPMEGIFVYRETVTDPNLGGDGYYFYPSFPETNNGDGISQLNLSVTKNRGAMVDNAIVRFDGGQMLPKFQLNAESTTLYIPQGNKDYAIVRSANEGEMPVSFKASENGSYTFNVDTENVEMNYLHLIDNMTGADIDLLATPSYTFEARTNDYTSRFRLVFSTNNGNNEDANEPFAFFNGNAWVVNNMGEATLQLIDITGRILSSENVNGNATLGTDNLSQGVYVMRLVNGNNVKTQKIVVR